VIGNIGNRSAEKQERVDKADPPDCMHPEDIHKLSDYNGCIVHRASGGVKTGGPSNSGL
jgi:hypothetical protein